MKILLHSEYKRGDAFPELGLGYLISYVNRYYPGIEFSVSFDREDVLKRVRDLRPDLIGFSSLTYKYKAIYDLAGEVKNKFPSIPLIIGGVHISLFPEGLPRHIDIGVLGEGEETFLELVRSFNESGILKKRDIKGIVFREGGEVVKSDPRPPIEPLDRIPPPDFEKIGIDKAGPAHLMTSRGCPFSCRFCTSKWFFRRPRFHSPEYVVNQIEDFARNYKRRQVRIFDDLFSMDKKRVKRIADLIVEKNLTHKLDIDVICHVKYIDEEVLKDFKRIGITALSLGMESGSSRILEYLKKGTVTLDDIRKAVRLCNKYDILPMGTFMVGSPYETAEDVQATIDFIKELRLNRMGLSVTTPFPGTEIWQYGKEKSLIKSDEWDDRLWGFHDINEETIEDKIILADMDKKTFLKMYTKLHNLCLALDRKREILQWLKEPYNLRLLFKHIKGRIKPHKKRFRRKMKRLFKKNKPFDASPA